ncbi:MAG: type II toxin-antitoxin system RelE family toxin [Pirellulales bacterium]
MATVVLTPEAAEQLDALPNPIHGRVLRLIVRLEQWPDVSGAKPLSRKLAGRWRMRTGDYRVQFHPERNDAADGGWLVTVEKIGHRDGFY